MIAVPRQLGIERDGPEAGDSEAGGSPDAKSGLIALQSRQ